MVLAAVLTTSEQDGHGSAVRAVVWDRYGPPEVLRIEAVPQCPWVPCAAWWPSAVPAKGMFTEICFSRNFCVLGERKSFVIMLPACRDGDETGNQRGWISAKFLALHS